MNYVVFNKKTCINLGYLENNIIPYLTWRTYFLDNKKNEKGE